MPQRANVSRRSRRRRRAAADSRTRRGRRTPGHGSAPAAQASISGRAGSGTLGIARFVADIDRRF